MLIAPAKMVWLLKFVLIRPKHPPPPSRSVLAQDEINSMFLCTYLCFTWSIPTRRYAGVMTMHSYLTTQNKSFFLIKGGTPSVLHQLAAPTGTPCNKCSFENLYWIEYDLWMCQIYSSPTEQQEQPLRLECLVMTCKSK